jgi:hypothetical protein
MSQRLRHLVPKVLSAGILLNLLLLLGCGGTAGIDNGQIIGKVYSNLQGTVAERNVEPGVTVVAESQSSPKLIRNAVTDLSGVFVFPGLPVGEYILGYAKEGFITMSTAQGSSATQTAIGTQIRLAVEPGRTSVAPDVTMRAAAKAGNLTLHVTVLDAASGEPITDATVATSSISTTENVQGVYTLSVPIIPSSELPFGSFRSVDINVAADGFNANTLTLSNITAGLAYNRTVRLQPLTSGRIEGTYRISSYQTLLSRITPSVRIKDFGSSFGNGSANSQNGTWTVVNLPPSTTSITRQYDIVFSHPDVKTYTLQRVVMPRDGTKTITQPVLLEPITVDVIGTIYVSGDAGVTQYTPNGAEDKVWIEETGQTASVVNGQFLIPKVPVQQATTDVGWNLRVSVKHPVENVLYGLPAPLVIRPTASDPNAQSNTWFAGVLGATARQ